MNSPDGPEERMAESIERAEQDMWDLDVIEMLAEDANDEVLL